MQQRDQEIRREDPVTGQIIGACIEVHRLLGPGLLESAYQQCLCRELSLRDIPFRREVPLPVEYKGMLLIELKAVDHVQPIHLAQVLTYLKSGGYPTGLLVNFNETALRRGLRRLTRQL